jgi:co-chaperonin GroES (HSP10)
MEVAEGDIVYFSAYSPDEVEFEWKKYLISKHNSILAKE